MYYEDGRHLIFDDSIMSYENYYLPTVVILKCVYAATVENSCL